MQVGERYWQKIKTNSRRNIEMDLAQQDRVIYIIFN